MRRVVVVGHGMAGARFAEEVLRRDPGGERVGLTLLGAERHPAYNRVLLSSVVAGALPPESVLLHAPDWAERSAVDLRLGASVGKVDRVRRVVQVDDGEVPYDALVLATGARPWLPPVAGLTGVDGVLAPGAVAFRTLDDCAAITSAARPGAPVVVLGGGLLGLEAARGLVARGCLVTVVHPRSHLMERQLDAGAGRVLARALGGLGVELRLGAVAERYEPGEGLLLADGTRLAADLLVVAAGVRPSVELAAQAGIAVDRGVLVDDALRTDDPRVHAIGDCAQHEGAPTGLVQPAWEQAAVLADRLTGTDPAARYRGGGAVTRLKARDVDLVALGEAHVGVDDERAEVLALEDPARGRYAKLVLRDDRVAGAILLGVPDAAAAVTQLYDRGLPAPSDRLGLLLGRALPAGAVAEASPADLPAGAVVCRCNTVSKGQLVSAWRAGARSVPGLVEATRASTGCGGCRDAVCGIADWLAAAE
ncbi:FAD-dependent oxidoreductase [Actinosynnema sp.]|uniref:FAD-dependent oxidoreductase n=1 Tax=Actinosynnema sp. TaxID=1872144 RepID=UPI003F859724